MYQTGSLKEFAKRLAEGILIVLPNTFNTFVGMLLGPMAFLFRLLIIIIS